MGGSGAAGVTRATLSSGYGSMNYRKLKIGSRDLGIYRAMGPISCAIRTATRSCNEIYLYPRFS
jgi:hypothetical protein